MAIRWKTTTNLLMVILFLNLSLGATASAAAISPAETNESITISKEAGTISVRMTDGEVIYTGTDDVQAVRSAIDAIDEGVILFNPGTYSISSPVELKSNIELVGDNAVMQGYIIFMITGKTDVTIRGFEFTNPAAQYTSIAANKGLIDITNSKNCVIEDNTFRNFRDYGINLAVGSTSHFNEQITIRNNEFLDYGYCGVMIWKQSNNIYVDDNVFKDINVKKVNGNAYGIALAKGSNSYAHSEYIYIRNNWIENNPVWEGIDSHGANHVYIQDNTVIDCKVPIAASYQTSEGTYPLPLHTIVITGNYVKGNMNSPDKQHSGIHVLGARNNAGPHQNVTISDNVIEDVNSWLVSDDGGIVLRDVDGGVIKNNTISGVGGTGINLNNANNLVLEENSIKNIKRISGSTFGVEMMPAAKDFSVTMKNNEFDSSVDYDAFSAPGYGHIYAVNAQEQDTSKFAASNGAMKLTAEPSQSTAEAVNNAGVTDASISISKIDGTTTVLTGSGETVYVGGSDTDAVKAAVNAVDNGTITFEQETYAISSPVALKSDIELIGNNAVITGYSIFTLTDLENVTVSGFEFINPDKEYLDRAGNNGLIYIQNSSNAFIRENTFRNFRDFGIYMGASSTSDRNQDITIQDNQFLEYGHAGVMIGKGASNVVVDDNLFRDINVNGTSPNTYGVAIMKGSSTYRYSDHIYIRNNTIENNPAGEAIDSHGANHLYIEDNTITDSRIPIHIAHINDDDRYPVPLHHLTVAGNNIKGNFDAEGQATGIRVIGATKISGDIAKYYQHVIVSGNTIEDAGNWNNGDEKAILMENVDSPVVENNVFSGADGK
ncbi:hypothetical protein Mpsy_0662 [Methanolobus psychrophilus R15]|nr:hypothetical protein Mpsy_0662 [Methanolobus psychrophilus R15]